MRNDMLRSLTMTLLVLCLASCSTMPETKIYSVSLPGEKGGALTKSDASLVISVESPRYLAQPYIAHRSSLYQLELSKYSKWDSAPVDIVKEGLRDSMSSMAIFKGVRASSIMEGESYLLRVNLKRFERYSDGSDWFGDLVLDAEFMGPDGREIFHRTIARKIKIDDRSYLSLAKGLSTALSESMDEIRTGIINALSKPVAQ